MATYDPGKLSSKLKDVFSELDQWTLRALDFTNSANEHQLQVAETVKQLQRTAELCLSQAQDDANKVEASSNRLGQLRHESEDTLHKTKATLSEAQHWQTEAGVTLKKWEGELQKAREWLARAEKRLQKAEEEYNRARRKVAAARSELSSAESALAHCRNDKNSGGCWGEEHRVSNAQRDLRAAEAELKGAERELQAAKAEVEAAEKRVTCCTKAVARAQNACKLAENAIQVADESVATAERSMESVHAAESALSSKEMSSAQSAAKQALVIANRFREQIATAHQHVERASRHFREAERDGEYAQRYAHKARRDLEDRISSLEQLHRMNVRGAGGTSFSERGSMKIKPKMMAVLLPIMVKKILHTHNQRIGESGEKIARTWAKQTYKGYTVIRGQYNKIHGIDLIVVGKDGVKFIEVKTHAKTPTLSTFGQQGSAATIKNRLEKAIDNASTDTRMEHLMNAQTLFNKESWESLGLGLGVEEGRMVLFNLKRRKPLR